MRSTRRRFFGARETDGRTQYCPRWICMCTYNVHTTLLPHVEVCQIVYIQIQYMYMCVGIYTSDVGCVHVHVCVLVHGIYTSDVGCVHVHVCVLVHGIYTSDVGCDWIITGDVSIHDTPEDIIFRINT